MKSLELFSGAGGLALGLEKAGFEHSGFVEFNRHACQSLRNNFRPDLVFEGDVRDVDFRAYEGVDIVAGGPPCQPFSAGGKHRAFLDDRDMFPQAVRAITSLAPRAFIFENVKGLLRKSFSSYFDYIIARLSYPEVSLGVDEDWTGHLRRLQEVRFPDHDGLKYRVHVKLLNSADFGVPQTRQRVFIVGIRDDIDADWHFPQETHSKESLAYEQTVSMSYWARHGMEPPADFLDIEDTAQKQSEMFAAPRLPWVTVRDALQGVPHPSDCHSLEGHDFRDGARSYPGHTGSFIDAPAKTLKAGVHGVPGGENMIRYIDGSVRYFSVFEGKLLQTFPPQYRVSGSWGEGMRQIGNAVPVRLAEILASRLKQTILSKRNQSKARAA
jgi:DNA (cytosine-5)-methyltransferase 1